MSTLLLRKRPLVPIGAQSRQGSYRSRHQPQRRNRQTPGRGTGWDALMLRYTALERAGNRCELIAGGERCSETQNLACHHIKPLADGGDNDPSNAAVLCRPHHRLIEKRLREQAEADG